MFKTLISLVETAQAVIGTASLVINGECVPVADLTHSKSLTIEADAFAHHPLAFVTETDESRLVASWLVYLAAKSGQWHGVTWTKLRNELMGHGLIGKLRTRNEQRVPDIQGTHPGEFRARYGGGKIVDLCLGVDQLRRAGLIEVITVEDADFLTPTDKLLELADSDLHQAYYH